MKTLSLKGRYIYLCLCASKAPFAAHFEFSFPGAVRISVSNMFREESYDRMTIHVPLQLGENRWSVVCIDSKGLMKRHGAIKDLQEKTLLKSVTICANMKISKVVTSDKLYDYTTFPKELGFKFVHKDDWLAKYDWLEPLPCSHPKPKPEETKVGKKETVAKKPLQPRRAPLETGKSEKEQLEEQARYTLIKARSEEAKAKFLMKMTGKENLLGEEALRTSARVVKMENDALIQLKKIMGGTIDKCPDICWGKSGDGKEIVYAAGSVIVAMNTTTEQQRLFKGYKGSVRALCLSSDGSKLVSAESDLLRLWNYGSGKCLGTWKAEGYTSLSSLALSPDAALLATAGLDSHGRDLLTVWDLNTLDQITTYQPHPAVFARQLSPYQIQCLRFGPRVETAKGESELQLCSCGKENIKFWLLKKQAFKSSLVKLNQYAQNSFFTCLEFESGTKVFVGSREGRILQVNGETQELEFVYQLHDAGINSLAICEAFCVTGSDDMYLRVWPLDFSEFFIEAKHESLIRSVAVSPDSVEILCATENNIVGVLDIPNQKYRTLIRSHTKEILAADVLKNLMVTVSLDKTIRVWDLSTMQQLYEFSSPEDQATCVAVHLGLTQFVCGFQSGTIRVFDLGKTVVTADTHVSHKPIAILRYLHKAELLIAVSDEGQLSFFSASTHQLIKQVPADFPSPYTGLSVFSNEQLFVTIGDSSTSLQLWDTAGLSRVLSIPVAGCQVRDVAARSEGMQVLAVTSDSQLRVFSVDGKPLGKFSLPCTDLSPLRKNVHLLVTQNGKYASLYGFSNGILQFPLQAIDMDASGPLGQTQQLGGLEIEEYTCHTSPVNVALFHPEDPGMFLSAGGSEGVFTWNFQGDTSQPLHEEVPPDLCAILRKSLSAAPRKLGFRVKAEEEAKEEEKALDERIFGKPPQNIRMDASTASKPPVEEEDLPSNASSQALLSKINELNMKKTELGIPSRHYMHSEEQEIIENPYLDSEGTLTPQFIVGYNGRSHDNIVWNESAGWAAYTVRNKLVVEEVLSKKQEMYVEHDSEISSIALSMDREMFATASGRKTDIALYNVTGEKPKLKFNKRFTAEDGGIHAIRFVGNHKFVCSLSCYPKTVLMVWNCSLGACVASETLKYPINDLRVNLNDETYLSFATIGNNEIVFWKIKPGIKAKLTKQVDAVEAKGTFACLTQTPFIESEGNRLFVIGTTGGSVLFYNTRNRNFIGEYSLLDSQVSCVSIHARSLVLGGLSHTLLKYEDFDLSLPNPFVSKPREIALDGNVTSISMDEKGNEGQIGTDIGTVWYVNWEENKAIKIHDGHLGFAVRAIGEAAKEPVFVSAAEDNLVKLWHRSRCDELQTVEIPGTTISCMALHKDLCILGSAQGQLRFFSLRDFKSLGKLTLSEGELTAIIAAGESLFVGDSLGALRIVAVDSLKPLVVKAKELLVLQRITGVDVQRLGGKNRFLTALEDGSVKVWERVTPAEKKEPFGLSGNWDFTELDSFMLSQKSGVVSKTLGVFFKRANEVLACTEVVHELVIRDIRMKQFTKRFKLLQAPLCLTLLESKNTAAIGGSEGILEIVELKSGKVASARVHGGRVEIISSRNDAEVITGSFGEIIKWKIA